MPFECHAPRHVFPRFRFRGAARGAGGVLPRSLAAPTPRRSPAPEGRVGAGGWERLGVQPGGGGCGFCVGFKRQKRPTDLFLFCLFLSRRRPRDELGRAAGSAWASSQGGGGFCAGFKRQKRPAALFLFCLFLSRRRPRDELGRAAGSAWASSRGGGGGFCVGFKGALGRPAGGGGGAVFVLASKGKSDPQICFFFVFFFLAGARGTSWGGRLGALGRPAGGGGRFLCWLQKAKATRRFVSFLSFSFSPAPEGRVGAGGWERLGVQPGGGGAVFVLASKGKSDPQICFFFVFFFCEARRAWLQSLAVAGNCLGRKSVGLGGIHFWEWVRPS